MVHVRAGALVSMHPLHCCYSNTDQLTGPGRLIREGPYWDLVNAGTIQTLVWHTQTPHCEDTYCAYMARRTGIHVLYYSIRPEEVVL